MSGDDITTIFMGPGVLKKGMTLDIPGGDGERHLVRVVDIRAGENGSVVMDVEPVDTDDDQWRFYGDPT